MCSVARAVRGRTSLLALRRRLTALPHHASAGRVARAAGQAREPAASGRVAGGRRCRARLSSRDTGGDNRVHLLPSVRKREGIQLESGPREPAGKARLHSGPEHYRPGITGSARSPHGAIRAPEAAAGSAGRCISSDANFRHSYRTRRLPRAHRQCCHFCPLVPV